ncbi:MAG: Holliday junction resolvase RuvX [Alphaproteobacteria bacterium]|nr:Holliday junction resolvase RuvX [Alphaproteobacteria bacterium]
MPIVPLEDLPGLIGPAARLVGLDVGTKTIGIAVSDPSGRIATPVTTLRRTRFRDDAAALDRLLRAREVAAVVVGLPVNMDGSEGPRAQSVRQFAANLDAVLALPIALWDERLSTAAVTRGLIAADASRRRRAEIVDAEAAAYILQGALDRLAFRARAGG